MVSSSNRIRTRRGRGLEADAGQGPANRVIHVLRSPSSVRTVAADTVWSPPLPRTVTVAARPDPVRDATRSPCSVPSVTGLSLLRAWAAVKRAAQGWEGGGAPGCGGRGGGGPR